MCERFIQKLYLFITIRWNIKQKICPLPFSNFCFVIIKVKQKSSLSKHLHATVVVAFDTAVSRIF